MLRESFEVILDFPKAHVYADTVKSLIELCWNFFYANFLLVIIIDCT